MVSMGQPAVGLQRIFAGPLFFEQGGGRRGVPLFLRHVHKYCFSQGVCLRAAVVVRKGQPKGLSCAGSLRSLDAASRIARPIAEWNSIGGSVCCNGETNNRRGYFVGAAAETAVAGDPDALAFRASWRLETDRGNKTRSKSGPATQQQPRSSPLRSHHRLRLAVSSSSLD
jgi:hypothetical protein